MPEEPPGEKTEEPTPKRRREAREEGKVAKSQELSAALTLLGSFLILYMLFISMIDSITERMADVLTFERVPEITANFGFNLLMDNIIFTARLVGPVMLAAGFVGVLVNFIQVGPIFTHQTLIPKFENLDPISGMKNIFSLKALVELVKSLLKAIVVFFLAYVNISNSLDDLTTLSQQGVRPGIAFLGSIIVRIAVGIIIFLIVLGVLDYFYQRWEYEKQLKMTKYEIKEERKEREGDPLIKQRRKERQKRLSVNRMMAAMEEADVVITNPTHIAVALEYDLESMEAPVVVAKGEGYVAQRIKDKAGELGIEIVEEKSLARALNKAVEIGDVIPAELYQAVAEILAFVFRKDNKY
ncbi:MAG: flagellar biosynthesis protein FlhB [Halanaerobiaceae bacterium]